MPDFEVMFFKADSRGVGGGKYKIGDVATVREWPNNGWGRLDDPTNLSNPFYSVVVQNVPSLSDLDFLLESEKEEQAGEIVTIRKRKKKIAVAAIPGPIMQELETTGRIFVDWSLVQPFIQDRPA
jgi:hypothetical protein